MHEAKMKETCKTLKDGGCRSIHIGGGEPFLDFDGLLTLVKTAISFGIAVDYVETNASWVTSADDVVRKLNALAKVGADTLCISVDPFHAEYIPYAQPLKLAEICRDIGFGYFLWQERFLRMMADTGAEVAHDRAALEKSIGRDYINATARAYGLKIGGRAINIEAEYSTPKPLEAVLTDSPCRGLLSANHFHVDMYNRFIPPGCTGFAVPLPELVAGLEPGKYPAFEASFSGGVAGLYELAVKNHGFEPEPEGYTSGCALCFHIRRFLSKQEGYPELEREFYEQSLRYY